MKRFRPVPLDVRALLSAESRARVDAALASGISDCTLRAGWTFDDIHRALARQMSKLDSMSSGVRNQVHKLGCPYQVIAQGQAAVVRHLQQKRELLGEDVARRVVQKATKHLGLD